MNAITVFTTRLENSPLLFGKFGEINQVKNQDLTTILLKTFVFDINDIRAIWAGVCEENKKKAIFDAWNEDKELAESLSEDTSLIDDDLLTELWEKQKEYLLTASESRGFWSVYPAKNHSAVYGLNVLKTPRKFKEWTESLVQIAKAISPNISVINLILHDKDFGIDKEYHVYTLEELHEIFGNEDDFSQFKRTYKIQKINIAIYQHNSAFADNLLKNEQLTDVHKEIDRIMRVAEEGTDFMRKLNRTVIELEENDPIGDSYNIQQ